VYSKIGGAFFSTFSCSFSRKTCLYDEIEKEIISFIYTKNVGAL